MGCFNTAIGEALIKVFYMLINKMILNKRTRIKIRDIIFQILLKGKRFHLEDSILIFSDPRGGSTWLSEILEEIPNTIISWEPLHVEKGVVPKSYNLGWRPYLEKDSKSRRIAELFEKILTLKISSPWTRKFFTYRALLSGEQVVTKFVRGTRLLPWLTATYPSLKYKPILLVRHPITTCYSQLKYFYGLQLEEMWEKKENRIFENPLPSESLKGTSKEVIQVGSIFEEQIIKWCIHNVSTLNISTEKQKWVKIYYEDLILNPTTVLDYLAENTGLPIGKEVIENFDFQRPSKTNYQQRKFSNPEEILKDSFKEFDRDQLDKIQAIFDFFKLKDYNALSVNPVLKSSLECHP